MRHGPLIALLAFSLLGCNPPRANQPGDPMLDVERVNGAPFTVAQWRYTTKDSDGNTLTDGLLTMPFPLKAEANFMGSWQAKYAGPDGQRDKIGPQVNGGKLSGQLVDGQLRLQLNPNMNDNNVTFVGTVDGDHISGTWHYSTFAGETNKGTFEALLSKQ